MTERPKDRLLLPLLIPLGALAAAGFVIFTLSRILLAVPTEWATPISLAMALNVLTACALIAASPKTRTRTLAAVLVAGSLVLTGGAVTAMAVSGELQSLFGRGEHAAAEDEHERQGPAHAAEEESEPGAAGGEEGTGGGGGGTTEAIVAKGTTFDLAEIVLTAGTESVLTFDNQDAIPHNVAIYTEQGGDALFQGELFPGPAAQEYTIPPIDAGTYYFQCDAHPSMNGTVTVG